MGTRNLTMVYLDGEYKVAKYCQWDGYPSGQGLEILNFLRSLVHLENVEEFKNRLNKLPAFDYKKADQVWNDAGADDSGLVSFDISHKVRESHPEIHRDTGAPILGLILNNKIGEQGIPFDLNFAGDSLFCEWGYVVDLDKNTFEVFEGGVEEPLTEDDRFHNIPVTSDNKGYYQIKLVKSYDLNNLPTDEEFLNDLEPQQEDEE